MAMFIEISNATTRCPCFLLSSPERGHALGCRSQDLNLRLRLCRNRDSFSLFLPNELLISWTIVPLCQLRETVLLSNGNGGVCPPLLQFCGVYGGGNVKVQSPADMHPGMTAWICTLCTIQPILLSHR